MPLQDELAKMQKRLRGEQDARSTVGQLSRGNNMYPGGNAARTGPMGALNQNKQNAVTGQMQQAQNAVTNRMKQAQMPGQPATPNLPPQVPNAARNAILQNQQRTQLGDQRQGTGLVGQAPPIQGAIPAQQMMKQNAQAAPGSIMQADSRKEQMMAAARRRLSKDAQMAAFRSKKYRG